MVSWLDDRTPLRHDNPWAEATVGDFAAGCLFWLRPGDFAELCGKLMRHPAPNAREILRAFFGAYTDDIAANIPAWLSNSTLRPDVLKLFRGVPRAAVRKSSMQLSLQQVLPTLLASTLPMQQRLDAARIAVASDVCISEAWNVVLTAYRRRFHVGTISSQWTILRRLLSWTGLHSDVRAHDLGMFLRYRREDVLALLRAELEASMEFKRLAGQVSGRAFETIDSLSLAASDPEALSPAVALLRTAMEGGAPVVTPLLATDRKALERVR